MGSEKKKEQKGKMEGLERERWMKRLREQGKERKKRKEKKEKEEEGRSGAHSLSLLWSTFPHISVSLLETLFVLRDRCTLQHIAKHQMTTTYENL